MFSLQDVKFCEDYPPIDHPQLTHLNGDVKVVTMDQELRGDYGRLARYEHFRDIMDTFTQDGGQKCLDLMNWGYNAKTTKVVLDFLFSKVLKPSRVTKEVYDFAKTFDLEELLHAIVAIVSLYSPPQQFAEWMNEFKALDFEYSLPFWAKMCNYRITIGSDDQQVEAITNTDDLVNNCLARSLKKSRKNVIAYTQILESSNNFFVTY